MKSTELLSILLKMKLQSEGQLYLVEVTASTRRETQLHLTLLTLKVELGLEDQASDEASALAERIFTRFMSMRKDFARRSHRTLPEDLTPDTEERTVRRIKRQINKHADMYLKIKGRHSQT